MPSPLPLLDSLSLRDGCVCTAPTGANMSQDQEHNQSVCFLCGGPMACALELGIGGTGLDDAVSGDAWKMLEGQFMDRRVVHYVNEANEEVQMPDGVPPEEEEAWAREQRQHNEYNLRRWSWDTAVLADGHRYHRRCLVDFYRREEQRVDEERRTLREKRAQTPPEDYTPSRPLDRFARCPKSVEKWDSVSKQNAQGYHVDVSPIRKYDPPPSAADVKDLVEDMEYDPKLGKGVSMRELDATEDEGLRFAYAKARVQQYLNPVAPPPDPAAAAMLRFKMDERDKALQNARSTRDELAQKRDEAFEKLAREKREADSEMMKLRNQKDLQEGISDNLKAQAAKSEEDHSTELRKLLRFIEQTKQAKAQGEEKADALARLIDQEKEADAATLQTNQRQLDLRVLTAALKEAKTEANSRLKAEKAKKDQLEKDIKAAEQRLASARVRRRSAQAKAQSLKRELEDARVHQEELEEAQKVVWAQEKEGAQTIIARFVREKQGGALPTPDRLLPTLPPPVPPPPKKKETKAEMNRRIKRKQAAAEAEAKAKAEAEAREKEEEKEAARVKGRIMHLKMSMQSYTLALVLCEMEAEWWREEADVWMHVMPNRLKRMQDAAAKVEANAAQNIGELGGMWSITDRDWDHAEWRRTLHLAVVTELAFLGRKLEVLKHKATLLNDPEWKRQKSAIQEAVQTKRSLDQTTKRIEEAKKMQRAINAKARQRGDNLQEELQKATNECTKELETPTDDAAREYIKQLTAAPADPLELLSTADEGMRKDYALGVGFLKTLVELYIADIDLVHAGLFTSASDPTTRGMEGQTDQARMVSTRLEQLMKYLRGAEAAMLEMQKILLAEIDRDGANWAEVDIMDREQMLAECEKHAAFWASDAFAPLAVSLTGQVLAAQTVLDAILQLFPGTIAPSDPEANAHWVAWARLAATIGGAPLKVFTTTNLLPLGAQWTKHGPMVLDTYERELLWGDFEVFSTALAEADAAVRKVHGDSFKEQVADLKRKLARAEIAHEAMWGWVRELRTEAYDLESMAVAWAEELETLKLLHPAGKGIKNIKKAEESMPELSPNELLMAFMHLRSELDMFDEHDIQRFLADAEFQCHIIATDTNVEWRMLGINKALSKKGWGLRRILKLFQYAFGDNMWTRCFAHLSYKDSAQVMLDMFETGFEYEHLPLAEKLKVCLREPRVKVAITMLKAHAVRVATEARTSMEPENVFRNATFGTKEQLIKRFPKDGTFNTMRDAAIAELEGLAKEVMDGKLVDAAQKMARAFKDAQEEHNICIVAHEHQKKQAQRLKANTGLGYLRVGATETPSPAYKDYQEKLRASIWLNLSWLTTAALQEEWFLAGVTPETLMNAERMETTFAMSKARMESSEAVQQLRSLHLVMTGATPTRDRTWKQPQNIYLATLLPMSWVEERQVAVTSMMNCQPDFSKLTRPGFVEELRASWEKERREMANVSDQVPNSTGDLWADLLQATAGTFAVGVRQYLATCRRHARLLYNAYHTISRSRQGSQAAITTLLKTMQNVAALLWNEIYTMEEAFEIFYPFKAINDVIHQHQNKLEEVKPDLTTLDADYRKFVEAAKDPANAEELKRVREAIAAAVQAAESSDADTDVSEGEADSDGPPSPTPIRRR